VPTFKVEIVDDRIMVEACLSVPPDGPKSDPYIALVDAGAQATMISAKVAAALGWNQNRSKNNTFPTCSLITSPYSASTSWRTNVTVRSSSQ